MKKGNLSIKLEDLFVYDSMAYAISSRTRLLRFLEYQYMNYTTDMNI